MVVRGGSSAGKTRAAIEAVAGSRGRLASWRLEYPQGGSDLADLLEAGISPRTVLWLGELRQYTGGPDGGAAVFGRLARVLEAQAHVIVITTMWPAHWEIYIDGARARDRTEDGHAGTVGRLLARLPILTGDVSGIENTSRGAVIDVPAEFSAAEVDAAINTGDPALAAATSAAASAGQAGQVAQYLAGAPDLLGRYEGPGGNRYGKAVIAVAMDAARLGYQDALPEMLLLEAAIGYLAVSDRTVPVASWGRAALDWATAELRGAVRAVYPVPPPHSTGTAGYRPADYLDQHGRRTRADQPGPVELWDALAAYTVSTPDLQRLGIAARHYGLDRHAISLWTTAAASGSAYAAARLIGLLARTSPEEVPRAARSVAASASLEDPWRVADLLRELHEAGAGDAAAALLNRDPAATVNLDDPLGVAVLLEALHEAHASNAVSAVLSRDPVASVNLDDPLGVAVLIEGLRETGASDAATTLAARAAAGVRMDDPAAVAVLIEGLREGGASDAAAILAARARRAETTGPPAGTPDVIASH